MTVNALSLDISRLETGAFLENVHEIFRLGRRGQPKHALTVREFPDSQGARLDGVCLRGVV